MTRSVTRTENQSIEVTETFIERDKRLGTSVESGTRFKSGMKCWLNDLEVV